MTRTTSTSRPGAVSPTNGSVYSNSPSPSASYAEPRSVNFPVVPVTSSSRVLAHAEEWAIYNFEMHARGCQYCHDAYAVHRAHGRLCSEGHAYAQTVASYIYSQGKGTQIFSATQTDSLVYVEVPREYEEIRSLLRAMERSLRHTRQQPIVSYDRTYYVAPRRTHSHRHMHAGDSHDEKKHHHHHHSHNHRNSAYYDDYKVDVRKPKSSSKPASYRHSGFW